MSQKHLVRPQPVETTTQRPFMGRKYTSTVGTMEIRGLMIYMYLILPVLSGASPRLVARSHQRGPVTLCQELAENFTCLEAMMAKSASTISIYSTWIQWLGSRHRFQELFLWREMLTQWLFLGVSFIFLEAILETSIWKTYMFLILRHLAGPSHRFVEVLLRD